MLLHVVDEVAQLLERDGGFGAVHLRSFWRRLHRWDGASFAF